MAMQDLLEDLLSRPGHRTERRVIPDDSKFFDTKALRRELVRAGVYESGADAQEALDALVRDGIIDEDTDIFPRDDQVPLSPPGQRKVYLVSMDRVRAALTV